MPSFYDEAVSRYGAEGLYGVTTTNPVALTAATALQTAKALGAVNPNMPNALVRAFQSAFNAAGPTVPLKVDGYWGPKTAAALATFSAPPPPLPAAVPNYSPPPPAASTPSAPPVANLRQAARSLSPQSPSDQVRTFQAAWNASGGVPTLVLDGIWGPATAGAVAQALGNAPRVRPPPTFVSPPANEPSLPVAVKPPTDPRPIVIGVTALAAGALLAWLRGKTRPARGAPFRPGRAPRGTRDILSPPSGVSSCPSPRRGVRTVSPAKR